MAKELKHVHLDMGDIEQIDKMVWRRAEGVDGSPRETNSMLSTRDYSIKCYYPHKIGVFHGIWVWWCDTHHQPLFHCDADRNKNRILTFLEAVKQNDKTPPYEYPGYGQEKYKVNAKGEKPAPFQRWLSPREMAEEFIKEINN